MATSRNRNSLSALYPIVLVVGAFLVTSIPAPTAAKNPHKVSKHAWQKMKAERALRLIYSNGRRNDRCGSLIQILRSQTRYFHRSGMSMGCDNPHPTNGPNQFSCTACHRMGNLGIRHGVLASLVRRLGIALYSSSSQCIQLVDFSELSWPSYFPELSDFPDDVEVELSVLVAGLAASVGLLESESALAELL